MTMIPSGIQRVRLCEDIESLQEAAYQTSFNSGFHAEDEDHNNGLTTRLRAEIGMRLMLITTEVAEAMEEIRDVETLRDLQVPRITEAGKPEGFGSELADIIVRVLDVAGTYGIDLADILLVKMSYNETRSERHGRKV